MCVCSLFSKHKRQSRSFLQEQGGNEYMRWEHDFDKEDVPELPLFDDYLEMGESILRNCISATSNGALHTHATV